MSLRYLGNLDFFQETKKQHQSNNTNLITNINPLHQLYEDLVVAGVKPDDFWQMSLDEIYLYSRSIKEEKKKELNNIQTLATLITNGVALVLNGSDKVKPIDVYKMHRELFKEDIKKAEKEEVERQLTLRKARMDAYMLARNKRKEG